MWFKTIFRRNKPTQSRLSRLIRPLKAQQAPVALFDEAFLRRMERMSLQAERTLRGNPASGEHASQHRMPASIFSDHRPYSHGDDLRYVDWNAYARHQQTLLKLGEAEQDVHVHLLFDISKSMLFGKPSRLHLAQQLIGALGYLALAHSDRLHIVPFGADSRKTFGPVQGKSRMIEMLRFIETTTPQAGTKLTQTLQRYVQQERSGGLLVLCSDLLSDDHLAAALHHFAPPRWQVVVLHLVDDEEINPQLQGPLELEDSETGERLQLTLDTETLRLYQQEVAAWREGVAQTCARRGAFYAPIMNSWPLEQKVVPYLRARRLLR